MGRIYEMNCHSKDVIQKLKEGKITGLTHIHNPEDKTGGSNLWPDGVTDGTNYGWFEENMILVWGTNNMTNIMEVLHNNGIDVRYIG